MVNNAFHCAEVLYLEYATEGFVKREQIKGMFGVVCVPLDLTGKVIVIL